MKKLTTMVLLAALGAGCGNYSSEDIDYQLALPDQTDLEASLPQALVIADSAEYYVRTREAVTLFNGILDKLTGLIDYVRAHPPSQRTPESRIWGPFPLDHDPRWALRVVITKQANPGEPLGFDFAYRLEFRRRALAGDGWAPLMTGVFSPSGGVHKGTGELTLDTAAARAAGYPVRDLGELANLRVKYKTAGFPVQVDMTVTNIDSTFDPAALYQYNANADGSGSMFFLLRERGALVTHSFEIRSRWNKEGEGRGDAKAITGPFSGGRGVDCWGPDTRATFSSRSWTGMSGDKSSCKFGDL